MTVDIIVTVVAGLFLAVAALGAVLPVLPGSPVAFVTLIVWGWILGSGAAWTAAAIGAVLCCVGFLAGALMAGRRLKQDRVPPSSTLVAVAGAIVGMFVIPVVGLFVGFALGLLVSEYARVGDFETALRSSGQALKALGLGMLVEFAMVCLASSVWMIGVIVHFATA